ncbi:O-antigen ligase family protein [Vibrio sp. SCSIO 43136]|uniref:O-antigen ligase family protein n=1 Tax=Vibrio sp. SCSIO 43136 TaxID=2819101 RepID=UPI0020754EB6|nr:O-antigen ligase family protein [Vibrio sp. SCSIO 43136]USD67030.1 O-antigen ligase family protein [Vibrio sp. SCSIO 43136]
MPRLERILFFSFLALLVWLPIPLGSNRPWAWSIAEIWISLQSIGLLFCYGRNLPWQHVWKFKFLLVPLGLFQCWVLLQTTVLPQSLVALLSPKAESIYTLVGAPDYSVSLDRGMTLTSLLRGVSYWLFLFNAILLINCGRRLKIAIMALVISGCFQAFYAAVMVLLGTTESLVFGYPEKHIATGSFVYKNHLANYLMMCLCMGLGLIVTELHTSPSGSWFIRIKRWLSGMLSAKMMVRLALIIMVIALVMTRSRMGNTAFFAATTIGGLLALVIYKDKPRALTVLVLSVLAIDTFVVGTLFGLEKVKQRLVETSIEAESRDQVVIWSLDIIKDYPLTGTGLASFYTVFPGYSKAYIGFYDHAHNDYIQFLVEAGIPATLMLGMMVLYALFTSLKVQKKRNSRTMKGLALGCTMAIIGMLIHISVDFNLQPMANALTFIFILFVAFACSKLPAQNRKAFVVE